MTADQKEPPEKKPPALMWAKQPFHDFLNQMERLWQLLHLSIRGISLLQGMPGLVKALSEYDQDSSENAVKSLDRAKEEADLAKRENSEGYPLLHAQATIAMWSALEATIRLFLARWLQNYEPAMKVEAVQKLKVRIGEYERLEDEARYFYILDRLEEELASSLKSGITRFETLLSLFGLSGPVRDDVKRDLYELNHIRNALVHRNGIADRRLAESCPWLNLKPGDLVRIDHQMARRYHDAVIGYATEIVIRIGEYFGVDMSGLRDRQREPEDHSSESTAT